MSQASFSESESNSHKLDIKIFLDDLPEMAARPLSCKQGIRTANFPHPNGLSLA
jgi:hypothetical protein